MTTMLCPKCQSESAYQDRELWVCAECAHEWLESEMHQSSAVEESLDLLIRDANGSPLADGDAVVVIKDLKVKGASATIKSGTKVRSIRLADGGDGHNLVCKIDGMGIINLKSEFVRKV